MKTISNAFTTLRIIVALVLALLSITILPKNDRGYAILGRYFKEIYKEMGKDLS
ncbi:MAG: hypothetical protein KF816_11610 [Melioribacteraceae bacterium]|nr:hypothetical protein [Melioribacteraceae bacterium]